jgi:hypothetical protein
VDAPELIESVGAVICVRQVHLETGEMAATSPQCV